MPTTLTKLEVVNMALDTVREAPAASLAVDSAVMRFLLRHYQHVVDMNLRSYNWNFAKERHELPEDGGTPLWGFSHRYRMPNGWLRLLKPTTDGYPNSRPIKFELFKDFLETDETAPRRIITIQRTEDPGDWDPLFTELVITTLGARMANKFTGKASYLAGISQLRDRAQAKAEEIDSFESGVDDTEQFDIIRARG